MARRVGGGQENREKSGGGTKTMCEMTPIACMLTKKQQVKKCSFLLKWFSPKVGDSLNGLNQKLLIYRKGGCAYVKLVDGPGVLSVLGKPGTMMES